jgi:hypothetical protein
MEPAHGFGIVEGRTEEKGGRAVSAITAASAGIDTESPEFVKESLEEFARRELLRTVLIELDDRDEFAEAPLRRECGEELGVQLLFIAEEYGWSEFDTQTRACTYAAVGRAGRAVRPADLLTPTETKLLTVEGDVGTKPNCA